MGPQERASARRSLDKRLNILQKPDVLAKPPRGWVKAIRESLGMTTAQLAKRLSVSQPRAVAIEKAETNSSITLESLEKTARALDCRLVYALVPRKPLETLAQERAIKLAERRLSRISHSMALEDQGVDATDEQEQTRQLAQRLLEKSGSKLWEDE
jgi:predicted DNA-binding mobile mystery protein A